MADFNKFAVISFSVLFWIMLPILMMLFNLSGYSQINPEVKDTILSENFNILTFSGLSAFISFIGGLSSYTIQGLNLIWIALLTGFGFIDAIALIFFIRGD